MMVQSLPQVSLSIGLLLSATLVSAGSAVAQTTFTSRAAWDAAVGPHARIDFEGLAPAGGTAEFPAGLTIGGVTFRGAGTLLSPPNSVRVLDAGVGAFVSVWSSGAMLFAESLGTATAGTVHPQPGGISLPAGVTAVGFNYATSCIVTVPGCVEQQWTVRLSSGGVIAIPGSSPPPTMAFWGVVSVDPISSIQVNPGATFLLLDNFSYLGDPVPTLPVWAYLLLIVLLAVKGVASLRRA